MTSKNSGFRKIPFFSGMVLLILLSGCYGTIHLKEEEPTQSETVDTASADRGQKLYLDNCQACHGELGRGNGPKANQFDPKPVDLLEPGLHLTRTGLETIVDFPHYSSEAMRRRIRHGTQDMPKFKENFSETEIHDIFIYLKYLSRRSAQGAD